jgi:chromosome segregation ATPase
LTNENCQQQEQVKVLNKRWALGEKALAVLQTQNEELQSAAESYRDSMQQKDVALEYLQNQLQQAKLITGQDAEALKKCRQDCKELSTMNVKLKNDLGQTRAERTRAVQQTKKVQSAIAQCRGDYAELNAKEQQSLAKIDTLQVDFKEAKRLATKHAATSAQLRDVKVVSVERQLRMMAADKNATAVRVQEMEEENTKLKGLVAIQQDQVKCIVWVYNVVCVLMVASHAAPFV